MITFVEALNANDRVILILALPAFEGKVTTVEYLCTDRLRSLLFIVLESVCKQAYIIGSTHGIGLMVLQ